MPQLNGMPEAASAGGYLLVLAIVLPTLGIIIALALGDRFSERTALVVMPAGVAVALAVIVQIERSGEPLIYFIGGWRPPLGVTLRADGLSALMLLATAVLVCGIGLFARADFAAPRGAAGSRGSFIFWTLLLALWAALNLVFLGNDLFNLYVGLELLTFGAVPLVCLDGRTETLLAALRYLLFALLGSVLYLLGASLFYGGYGTLDIVLLASRVRAEPVAWTATALMTAGLLAKAALWPLHLWLPPAHAGAPAPASAMLSALVVKAPFFITVRLWFDIMPGQLGPFAGSLLGIMGTGAVLFGSVQALRQARLKLLIAYSTVAQLGYLFLMFPLAASATLSSAGPAWTGGALQAISHAFAKAAMFAGAGLVSQAVGHDRIAGLYGLSRILPMTVFGFGFAGLSLIGLPPSGGFLAKWLLLIASISTDQWWWAIIMLGGGLLAGGYIMRVMAIALARTAAPIALSKVIPRHREAIVLALAIISVLIGVVPLGLSDLLEIGRVPSGSVALR
jgi:formate hydrogenlyase subunit 3/multisubunit Na+/H+ antiporter MnhD subunit